MGSSVRFGELENKSIENIIHINSTAPLMLSQKLTRYLEKANSPCILNISSWLGSIGGKKGGGNYGYCGSKALLNMYSKAMAHDLREKNIRVFAINPGWMKTKMGGEKQNFFLVNQQRQLLKLLKISL